MFVKLFLAVVIIYFAIHLINWLVDKSKDDEDIFKHH